MGFSYMQMEQAARVVLGTPSDDHVGCFFVSAFDHLHDQLWSYRTKSVSDKGVLTQVNTPFPCPKVD